jgi:hypothetical protein
MTAAATTQMSAVQHAVPLPPTSAEPRTWFDPIIEPVGESMRAGPLTSRLVRLGGAPGVVAAALVPAEPGDPLDACLPAEKGLLAELADEKPLTFRYLVRTRGWDGMPAEDPIAEHLSPHAVALLAGDTDEVLRRAGIGGERLWR